ncbi:MAG TPA: hypothetical protein VHD15_15705 [Hyphomicrobiales bacterium]|nr:hypothetical protein [Hyphomicrobiales bacterium]
MASTTTLGDLLDNLLGIVDAATGTGGANTLAGGAGNDRIAGGALAAPGSSRTATLAMRRPHHLTPAPASFSTMPTAPGARRRCISPPSPPASI